MIAAAKPEGDEPPDGGRGEGVYLSPVQENKIVSMMLNPARRWKVTPRAKHMAMKATLANLGAEDGRVVNAAVANLLRMERQNQDDEHKLLDKLAPDQHAHQHAHAHVVRQVLTEIEGDERLERLAVAVATGQHPGDVGAGGIGRTVAATSAPASDQQGGAGLDPQKNGAAHPDN